jgi:hypothetical protein
MRRRPPTKMFGIMLSANERKMVEVAAAEAEMTMSEYVRMLIRQADRERKTVSLPKTKKRVAEYV